LEHDSDVYIHIFVGGLANDAVGDETRETFSREPRWRQLKHGLQYYCDLHVAGVEITFEY